MNATDRRIVQAIVRGLTYGEIAMLLAMSERTVRWHAERIAALLPLDGQPRRSWSVRKRIRDMAEQLLAAA